MDEKLEESKIIKRVIPRNDVTPSHEGTILDDSVLYLGSTILGDMAFVRKKTQYVENPADGMLILKEHSASQITDLTIEEGTEFFRILLSLGSGMRNQLGYGSPTISINQQRDCRVIPNKYLPDGTEVKVQTLDQLHAHVFIEDGSGYELSKLSELQGQDLYDHNDPYGNAATEILAGIARQVIDEYGLQERYAVQVRFETFPMGLRISTAKGAEADNISAELFMIMRDIQFKAYEIYSDLENLITKEGILLTRRERAAIAHDWLSSLRLSESSYRKLYELVVGLKQSTLDEVRPYLRLIQGPALTWVIQNTFGNTSIYVTPRIFSRGNAMEMLGVYVDNEGVSSSERTGLLNQFYKDLRETLRSDLKSEIGVKASEGSLHCGTQEIRAEVEDAFASSEYLSPTIRAFYLDIVVDLVSNGSIDINDIIIGLDEGKHIHQLLSKPKVELTLESISPVVNLEQEVRLQAPIHEETINTNSPIVARALSEEFKGVPFAQRFRSSTPVTSNTLVLEASETSPKIMFFGGVPHVVVNLRNDISYLNNYYKLRDALIASEIQDIKVIPEIGVVLSQGNLYFISRYMGYDYETAILDDNQRHLERDLERVAKSLETTLVSQGLFFRNIAPRNLIRGEDGSTYVIDFDHILAINEETELDIYLKHLNRLAWFADIFDTDKIKGILHAFDFQDKGRTLIPTGPFERYLLGSDIDAITIDEYRTIFQYSLELERRDYYKGVSIYGHQLGRFVSDYWGDEKESKLIRLIATMPERIHEFRAVLYFASKIDQELCLRKMYGLDGELVPLSVMILERLETHSIDLSSFFIMNRGLSFRERYNQIIRESGLQI